MTAALAPHWIAAGHDVMIGGRTTEHARALAERLGARHGSLAEAADHGDVLLLAVRSEGLDETLELAGAARGGLRDKVVVDCGNAVHLTDFSRVTWDGRSLAEWVEFRAMGGQVVKAFNLCHHEVWRDAPTFGGRPLAVPLCGSEAAKAQVVELVRAVGGEPLDVGDLSQARHLEAMAIVMIRALRTDAQPMSAFAFLPADEPGGSGAGAVAGNPRAEVGPSR